MSAIGTQDLVSSSNRAETTMRGFLENKLAMRPPCLGFRSPLTRFFKLGQMFRASACFYRDATRSVASASLGAERSAAAACPFDIGVVEHEAGLHQLVFIIHLGAVKVMDAFRVE